MNRDDNPDARIRVVLTGSHAASACGLTVDLGSRRRGSPICKLARLLVDVGHDPDTPVHIHRDGTLCFQPMPLGRLAGLTTSERDGESVRFERWRPMPSARRAVARFTGPIGISRESMPASDDGALTGVCHD